jgi:hypothetical protein
MDWMIWFIDPFFVQYLLITINCKNSQSMFWQGLAPLSCSFSFYNGLFSVALVVRRPIPIPLTLIPPQQFSYNFWNSQFQFSNPLATNRLSLHNLGSDPMENMSHFIKNACLLIHYLAMDVLLLSRANLGNVFTKLLPSNGHMHHNMYVWQRTTCLGLGHEHLNLDHSTKTYLFV